MFYCFKRNTGIKKEMIKKKAKIDEDKLVYKINNL